MAVDEKEDVFAEAFDEATAEGAAQEKESTLTDTGAETGKAIDEPKPGEDDKHDENSGETGSPSEEQGASETKAEDTGAKPTDEGGEGQAVPYEKLLQQHKSLQGMFNADRKKIERLASLEAELAELRAAKAGGEKAGDTKGAEDTGHADTGAQAKTETTDLPAYAENQIIKTFGEDYPDVHAGVEEMLKYHNTAMRKSFEAFARIIAPVLQDKAASYEEKRDMEVAKSHSDFQELKSGGQLGSWVESLPAFKQQAYKEALANGEPAEVVLILDEYKAANGTAEKVNGGTKPVNEIEAERLRKLKNSETVRSKGAVVSGKGSASKDDFEGSFKEATGAR